jgi:hypothetical protein
LVGFKETVPKRPKPKLLITYLVGRGTEEKKENKKKEREKYTPYE